ncbi:MAG: TerC family protein [Bdellovibrionaceae bacterium]|nr:TerC family protein [Pseudobdellovibrionaceae bacterium]
MLDFLASPEAWLSLLMLSTMEVVLGIDNLIFISILAAKLPHELRDKARRVGLAGAFITRLGLLAVISWIARLTTPLFTVFNQEFSGKSLILIGGGLFLLYKATNEIHHKLEGEDHTDGKSAAAVTFGSVIVQVMLLDLVFSLDSVITAVGMTPHIPIMVVANVVALLVMLAVGGTINGFIERHPTIKILALSFLLMIGLVLIGEGAGFHIPKGYVYFSMGFSIAVEMINMALRRRGQPVHLHTNKPG